MRRPIATTNSLNRATFLYISDPMWRLCLLVVCLMTSALAAEKRSAPQLIELAKSNSGELREAITANFEPKDLTGGTVGLAEEPTSSSPISAPSQPAW